MPLVYSVDPSLSLEERQAAESKIVHEFFARQAYQAHRAFQLMHRKQQQEVAAADADAGDENLDGQVKRLPELSELRFPVSKQQKQQQRLQEKAPGSEQPQSKYVSASQLFAQQQAREQDPELNAREAEQELRLQRERFEAAKKRFQNSNTKNEEIKDTKKTTKRTNSKKKRQVGSSRIIIVTDCKNEEYLKNRKMKKIEAMEKKKNEQQQQQQQQQQQSLTSVGDAGTTASYGSFTADPIATRINTTASNSTTTCTESGSPTNNAGSSTNAINNSGFGNANDDDDDQEGGDDDRALTDDMIKQYSISPTIAEPSQGRNQQQQGFPIGSQQQQQQRQSSQPQGVQQQTGMQEHRTDTDDFDWTDRIKTKKGSNLTPSDPISPVPPEQ